MTLKCWLCVIFTFLFSFGCVNQRGNLPVPGVIHVQADGGWVSNGGEYFQYAKNPWFLKNVKDVRYCVRIDQAGISAESNVIREKIRAALQYWREELTIQHLENGMARIATQDFTEVEDCAAADVQFLFGYGALNADQVKFLKDPQKYIGVTVRTDYDEVNLRGKGFVFISSDTGSHPYNNPGQLIQKAWSYPKLLQYALMHELGHMFGVPHSGSGLMSEIFLDRLLYKELFEYYLKKPFLPFVKPPKVFESCIGFNSKFFQVTKPIECLVFETKDNNLSWTVSVREKLGDEPKAIGLLKAVGASTRVSGSKPALIVQLPKGQKVFDATEFTINNYMVGPVIMDFGIKGFYRTLESAKVYDTYIDLKVDSVTIIGNLEDGLFPVFSFAIPAITTSVLQDGR